MQVLTTLRKPIVTEKSTILQERNQYVFHVAPKANKSQVKEAVERAFDVKVLRVRIMVTKGEWRAMGPTRRMAKLSDVKKAIVTLRQGDTIQLFEGA
jgi:large subunit ribosomal protein L23